jgi:hypothetical protein
VANLFISASISLQSFNVFGGGGGSGFEGLKGSKGPEGSNGFKLKSNPVGSTPVVGLF